VLPVPSVEGDLAQFNALILTAYDVRNDHVAMQTLLKSCEPAIDFDALRKHYPLRHEFNYYSIDSAQFSAKLCAAAAAVGFRIGAQS